MPTQRPSSETGRSRPVVKHWAALRKHWLFSVLVVLLSPLLGFLAAGDRGLMLGLAVGVLSGLWIWWEGEPADQNPDD